MSPSAVNPSAVMASDDFASAIFEQSVWAFLAPIQPLLGDSTVSEIMLNGPTQIYVERRGALELTELGFPSLDSLMAALRNIAQFNDRTLDVSTPLLDGHLPDGSRIAVVLPPAGAEGPYVAIRRVRREPLTLQMLLSNAALSPDAADYLAEAVRSKRNVVVSGGTGSGKTSLLNVLSSLVPETERMVVIEDTRELRLQQPHVVHLLTRPANSEGDGRITVRDLFRSTLRLRPDRILLGEIRGGEALELIQAMTSGHRGCLATVHASHPRDALARLETMALESDIDLPLAALRPQVASAVDLIVQTSRMADGQRGVTHITEVEGICDASGYRFRDLFRRPTGTGEAAQGASAALHRVPPTSRAISGDRGRPKGRG